MLLRPNQIYKDLRQLCADPPDERFLEAEIPSVEAPEKNEKKMTYLVSIPIKVRIMVSDLLASYASDYETV